MGVSPMNINHAQWFSARELGIWQDTNTANLASIPKYRCRSNVLHVKPLYFHSNVRFGPYKGSPVVFNVGIYNKQTVQFWNPHTLKFEKCPKICRDLGLKPKNFTICSKMTETQQKWCQQYSNYLLMDVFVTLSKHGACALTQLVTS